MITIAKINIKGTIIPNNYQDIYDWFGMEATSPKSVNAILNTLNGEDVDVEINSPGGMVSAGSEIYTALKAYQGNVNVLIVGIAASAASVIAMAGNKVSISPTAQIMIHNVSTWADGDYRDMQQAADMLKNMNTSIANAYILKTGMDKEVLLDLMDKETWLNAQQAKEMGFADEVLFDNENLLVASDNLSVLLPPAVVNKIRNLLTEQKNKQKNEAVAVENERLQLLKLRGIN